jgi:hypothetical protein
VTRSKPTGSCGHDGKARTCLHNPTPRNGMPVVMSAGKCGLVVCGLCTELVTAPSSQTVANLTCDGCGYVAANTAADHLVGGLAKLQGLTYVFAVCALCRGRMSQAR